MKLSQILISIAFFSNFLSCKPNPFAYMQMPVSSEYNEVIIAVLDQDIYFLKHEKQMFLIGELASLSIKIESIKKEPVLADSILVNPPPIEIEDFHTSFQELIEMGIVTQTNSDSLYLVFQRDSMQSVIVDRPIFKRREFVNYKYNLSGPILQFSVPVMNSVKDKAFVMAIVQGNYILSYRLDKVKNKWVVTNTAVMRAFHDGCTI